jgi:hypothetical protein
MPPDIDSQPPAIDRDDLRETEGVPLVLPNELQGPARAKSDVSLYTGNLAATGLRLKGLGEQFNFGWLVATVLAVGLGRALELGPLGILALLALGIAVVEGGARLWRWFESWRLSGIQERSRRQILARRSRHVPDTALSPSREPAAADRGVSRDRPEP